MDAIVESNIPLIIDVHGHDTSDSAPELVKSSISSQIFRYSFATLLTEDEIDHETVDFSIVTSSGPSESPCADYSFMVIATESSSIESSEFLITINRWFLVLLLLLVV